MPFDPALLDGGARDAGDGGSVTDAGTRECRDPTVCGGGVSCCERASLPSGSFDRGYDLSDSSTQPGGGMVVGWQPAHVAPATLAPFEFDVFEVTVSRFRRFVDDYDAWRASGHPAVGEGAHPRIAGSGWQAAWSAKLPTSASALSSELTSCGGDWSSAPAGKETNPISCATWFEAMAFCAWEGGRLATEAEWNFASAGGDEQRAMPWSTDAGSLAADQTHAVFNGLGRSAVGSRGTADLSRWGQHDLAGNVREWVVDASPGEPFSYTGLAAPPCENCANVSASADDRRIRRGGAYDTDATRLRSAYRSEAPPDTREDQVGFRCAR